MSAFKLLLQEVESELAKTYRFDLAHSASDFLASEESAQHHAPQQRAAVLVYQDLDELHLGLYLSKPIIEQILAYNPLEELSLDNLDAFCVLVEELSHFHLIANRAATHQSVSRLELEWQGEIDKVLLAGNLLLKQTGTPCFQQLTHLIFDRSVMVGTDTDVYEEALRFAAQHWYRFLQDVKGLGAKEQWVQAKERFQPAYNRSWSEKLVQLRPR